ncbi:universal stress protein [Pusillimonas sp. DMV24BSW_D]|uniref:universal stress protein n=1 Tax=Neopusillimonas aestuarii TaxID=2716226 RepID=UPI0014087075|nr:universal stress protein [Pusillimonas sp. DMV24BSW_D]QIM49765.1 universal stress protein [Pusillimonas sp. DMV24BSW_D]
MLGRIAIDLTKDGNHTRRLDTTLRLAKTHEAEVVGVYPRPESTEYLRGGNLMPPEVSSMVSSHLAEERMQMHELFQKRTQEVGVKATWREPQGFAEEVLAIHARYCDLLVMSQSEKQTSSMRSSPAETVITTAGRPVLMVPFIGEINPIGKRILFCWDRGRRAARALADAGPILRQAKDLVVLTIDENRELAKKQDLHDDDFNAYCASRGYPQPKFIRQISNHINIGTIILNGATDQGCDMVVMGAYNRSRTREWVLGGTSKTLLDSMTVPILFSH